MTGYIIDIRWEGIAQNAGANGNGYPPDNALAVGPTTVVSSENSAILISNKDKTSAFEQSLNDFFGISDKNINTFDPRIVYDATHGQYIVVADATKVVDGVEKSSLLIAVSKDSNVNDGWNIKIVDTSGTFGTVKTWADYPMIAVDNSNLYITTNNYAAVGANETDPPVTTSLTIVNGVFDKGGPSNSQTLTWDANLGATFQPAAYSTGGTFLVSHSVYNALEYSYWKGSEAVTTKLSLGQIEAQPSSGAYEIPQPNTAVKLLAGDVRIASTALSADHLHLYAVFEVTPTTDSVPLAHWVDINVANPLKPLVADQGNISLPSGAATFNPSIAVNGQGDVLINFTSSSANTAPTDFYTIRPAGASGSNSFSAAIPYMTTGQSYSYEVEGKKGLARWGDYSSAIADPQNSHGFWISNEFVEGPLNWGTVTAHVVVPTVQVTGLYPSQLAGVSDAITHLAWA